MKKHKRSTFSGKLGFVLSAAGASVGLGNIWRFPYLAAKYGGGIFLLVYIILALTFGYTLIMAETSLGRMTRKSPVGAFESFGNSHFISIGGWINAIIPILIVPYYSVIGGWVIKYLIEYFAGHSKTLAGDAYFTTFISNGWSTEICFIIFTLFTLGIIGGIKRISKVSEVIVPFMAVTYIGVCLIIVFTHLPQVPAAFAEIVQSAFGLKAVAGGAIGAMTVAMQKGIARGIFSNEAGLGSAPIAAAAAQTNEPVRQGLVSMTGTFIDTIIVCTMTGLAIVMTGAWDMGLEGVAVTTKAFALGLPFPAKASAFVLMMCLVFFAFTTILGWAYYSERCLEYLVNGKKFVITAFKWFYILAVFIGPFMTVSAVWTIADICNGLMAFPNLVALLALNGDVVSETRGYLERVGIVKTTVGEA